MRTTFFYSDRVASCNKLNLLLTIFLIYIAVPSSLYAVESFEEANLSQINNLIANKVKDNFEYYGLASFYNNLNALIIDEQTINDVAEGDEISLTSNQYLAIIGHYKVLLLYAPNTKLIFADEKISVVSNNGTDFNPQASKSFKSKIVSKAELDGSTNYLSEHLKYHYLWLPFQWLTMMIEKILLWLNLLHSLGWGFTIIIFSILFKLFILPANILLLRIQRKTSHTQAKLASKLQEIKQNYRGEEAHKLFMEAHKENGVTPFYTIKPLFFSLMPLPFWIAIFNALGEMNQISGQAFLWITDLALPDAIFITKYSMPLLGQSINLLPIIMTALVCLAAIFYQNKVVTCEELKKQKLNLYLMAGGFFILFYPFPASMVLYWTLANFWQFIQQSILKI